MEEKKNKTYAGQVADIARKDVHLSFTDRLSRMTEEEGDPFLNIFSAKSIYLARISHFDQGDNNKPAGQGPAVPRTDHELPCAVKADGERTETDRHEKCGGY